MNLKPIKWRPYIQIDIRMDINISKVNQSHIFQIYIRYQFIKQNTFWKYKNLFAFWKQEKKDKNKEKIFLDFSKKWISADKAKDYALRNNCIYLLYDSTKKEIYVGKANEFGKRVKKGEGRIGLSKDWDKFMYFELNPTYQVLLEQMETFSMRLIASILKNNFNIKELKDDKIKLVNLQLKNNK